MKRMTRPSVRDLEEQKRELELRIHKLERRGVRMTPLDQQESARLKKLRLATKDQLTSVRS
jgi:uncharacterized protein YdcH (DUF465 family)